MLINIFTLLSMISKYFRISHSAKYLFSAVITAFLTGTCTSTENDSSIAKQYESTIKLKFPESIIDLACLANTFPSQFKKKSNDNSICLSQVLKNYKEIKQISGLFYDNVDESFISNTYPWLGIKGLHLKVFETKVFLHR